MSPSVTMISSRVQHRPVPTLVAAHSESALPPFQSLTSRRRQYRFPNFQCGATLPRSMFTSESSAIVPHKSTRSPCWTSSRTKHSWHRPRCSVVTAEDNRSIAPREVACVACQDELRFPFGYFRRDFKCSRQDRELDAMRKRIEEDPYDALFGWSNRHLNKLWDQNTLFAMTSNIDSLWSRRVRRHSNMSRNTRSSSVSQQMPTETRDSDACLATSNTEANGFSRIKNDDSSSRRTGKCGDAIYDPISNRMVRQSDRSEDFSVTALREGARARPCAVRDISNTKYADCSARKSLGTVSDQISNSQSASGSTQQKIEIDYAKSKAPYATDFDRSRKEAHRTRCETSSVLPSANLPANIGGAPMQRIICSGEYLRDKYVTPSQDLPDVSEEVLSTEMRDRTQEIQEKETQLGYARKQACFTSVNKHTEQAGRIQVNTKPERPMSEEDTHQLPGQTPPLVSSLDRYVGKATYNVPKEKSPSGLEIPMSGESEAVAPKHVKARERTLGDMKHKSSFSEVNGKMKQPSGREMVTFAGSDVQTVPSCNPNGGGTQDPHDSPTKSWTDFKAGAGAVQSDSTPDGLTMSFQSAISLTSADKPQYGRTTIVSNKPTSGSDALDSSGRPALGKDTQVRRGQPAKICTESSNDHRREGSLQRDRRPVSCKFGKESPLSTLASWDLAGRRSRLLDRFNEDKSHRQAEVKRTTPKLATQVSAQKIAPSAVLNRTESCAQSVPTSRATAMQGNSTVASTGLKPQPALYECPNPSPCEGDISPRVVRFAHYGRWYKDRANHAKLADAQTGAQDSQLVQDIQTAPKSAYRTSPSIQGQEPLLDNRSTNHFQTSLREPGKDSASHSGSPFERNTSQPSQQKPFPSDEPKSDLLTQSDDSQTLHVRKEPVTDSNEQTVNPLPSKDHRHSRSTARLVRREEPVFSGQLPIPKYTIPEAVQILRRQSLVKTAKTGPSSASRPPKNQGSRPSRRQRSREWKQNLRLTMFGGGLGAACCYAIGILVEYGREPSVVGGCDQATPTWEEQRSRRGNSMMASMTPATPAHAADIHSAQDKHMRLSDTPLRGLEYPMMGILVACIWYIVSSGSS